MEAEMEEKHAYKKAWSQEDQMYEVKYFTKKQRKSGKDIKIQSSLQIASSISEAIETAYRMSDEEICVVSCQLCTAENADESGEELELITKAVGYLETYELYKDNAEACRSLAVEMRALYGRQLDIR